MKINGTSNNSFQNKVLLDTFVEQISALQEDVAHLQDADIVLDNKISQKLSEEDFSDFQANANVSNLHAAELNSEAGFIGHLSSNQVDAENAAIENAEVQNLTALNANIPSLTTDDVTVQGNITSAGDITAKDAVLDNVSADKVETPLVEADLVKADIIAEDVETDTATVKDKLTVKDIEVSGTVTGLSEINADSVNANEAEIETINTENIRSWISQVMNQEESMLPTPQLDNNDRYTIELPRFNGVYLLSWEDQDVVWSATVIGNGKSYGISWSSRTDENFITDLFQYNGKLYIRVNSNGRLKFAYSATKELPQPVIYYNMVGWTSDKSLEQLCDEKSHIINMYPAGMIWFGKVIIPRLETVEGDEGAINFKGSCAFNELPSLTDTDVGDVWNITNEAYTDNRFVEGAGKPINAGDDVVAVEVKHENGRLEQLEITGIGEGEEFVGATELSSGIVFVSTKIFTDANIYEYNLYRVRDLIATKVLTSEYNAYSSILETSSGTLVATPDYDAWGKKPLYSEDGGLTWLEGSPSSYFDATYVGTHSLFENDGIVYWLTKAGFYKSADFGRTWEAISYTTHDEWGIPSSVIATSTNECLSSINRKLSEGGGSCLEIASFDDFNFNVIESSVSSSYPYSGLMRVGNYVITGLTPYIEAGPHYYQSIYRTIDGENIELIFDRDILGMPRSVNYKNGILTICAQKDDEFIFYKSEDFGSTFDTLSIDTTEIEGTILEFFYNGQSYYIATSTGVYAYSPVAYKTLQWDKFAAGVNYENFVAQNITASTALKSEGTLEVDGTSQFDDDVTVTGDVTQTGDLNITGNETLSGDLAVSGKVESDKLYGKELHVNDTGNDNPVSSYLDADSTGIISNVNITENGNITQTGTYTATGNQTITGNLTRTGNETISGVVIIGELD